MGCFTEFARVKSPTGFSAIQDIRAGDFVLRPAGSNELVPTRVHEVFESESELVTLVTTHGNIVTTPDQLFLCHDGKCRKTSEMASQLVAYVLANTGGLVYIRVIALIDKNRTAKVYHLHVDEPHLYLVEDSSRLGCFVVHNKGGGGSSTSTSNLPKWLQPYAQSFIGTYGRQVFGPSFTPGQPGNVAPRPEELDQLVAAFAPEQNAALSQIAGLTPGAQGVANIGAGQNAATLGGGYLADPTGGNPFLGALQGTVGGQFTQDPTGQNPYLGALQQTVAGGGLQNPIGANPYLSQGGILGQTTEGQFLSPETNPFLKSTFDAASSDLVNAYSTATAPSIMAAAQRAGQFGSSAMDESLFLSRYGLGRNLENLASNIYGGNYSQERGRQEQAGELGANLEAGGYRQERGLMEQQARGLADIYQGGYGRERGLQEGQATNLANIYQGGYEGERERQMQSLGLLPSTLSSVYQPAGALMGAGALRQEQGQTEMDTNYLNAVSQAEYPFSILSGMGGALGQAGSGAGTSTTRTSGGGGGLFGK